MFEHVNVVAPKIPYFLQRFTKGFDITVVITHEKLSHGLYVVFFPQPLTVSIALIGDVLFAQSGIKCLVRWQPRLIQLVREETFGHSSPVGFQESCCDETARGCVAIFEGRWERDCVLPLEGP